MVCKKTDDLNEIINTLSTIIVKMLIFKSLFHPPDGVSANELVIRDRFF